MGKTRRNRKKTNSLYITDALIKKTIVKNKVVRITDIVPGLFIAMYPTGVKTWYMRKFCDEKRLQLRIGRYSDGYTIDQAREAARQINNYANLGTAITAPTMLTANDLRRLNPRGLPPACTFKELYEEWHMEIAVKTLDPRYLDRVDGQINTHVLPRLGDCDVSQITPGMIHAVAKDLENAGKTETAHRIISLCGRIFRYGGTVGKTTADPTATLKGSIASVKTKHMPSIDASDTLRIGELIYNSRCCTSDQYKMVLMQAYTFVRPNELRSMEWEDLDLNNALWKIPAEKMKMSSPHLVPLSKQALNILNGMTRHKGNSYVFPLYVNPGSGKPSNANTVLNAIKTLGFKTGEMSAHGFRSIASTVLNESGKFNSDAIERQLSHVPGNRVRAAYNYAQHIKDRRAMMQWYADELDSYERKYAAHIAKQQGWKIVGTVDNEKIIQEEKIRYYMNSNKIHDIKDNIVDLHRFSYM